VGKIGYAFVKKMGKKGVKRDKACCETEVQKRGKKKHASCSEVGQHSVAQSYQEWRSARNKRGDKGACSTEGQKMLKAVEGLASNVQ